MTQELLINVSPRETRIALVSQGYLRELFIEREEHRSLVGNVYLGRVTKILAGANAAFVDCGLERSAFLVANDARPPGDFQNNRMDISDLVQEGAEVIVQVIKEPIGDKGARVRSRIALAGRYLVLIPDGDKVNISRRLTDIEERARLTTLIEGAIEPGDGVIIRTVSQGVESEDLANDLLSLKECWSDIQAASDQTDAPSCIHAELDLVLRILRDRLSISIDAVFIDDRAIFSSAQDFCKRFMPTLADRVELLTTSGTAFDNYEIEQQIEDMIRPEVSLRSGGTLYIEETRSMTVIDVNTARFKGSSGRKDAVFQTNMEAAREVAQQLHLRNIGGIVVVDFINMESSDTCTKVFTELETALANDPARVHLKKFSEFGLVELTRMRTRESYAHEVTEVCEHCQGVGRVKTAYTVAIEILRSLSVEVRFEPGRDFSVVAAPEVVAILGDQERAALENLQYKAAASLKLVSDSDLEREAFELVPL